MKRHPLSLEKMSLLPFNLSLSVRLLEVFPSGSDICISFNPKSSGEWCTSGMKAHHWSDCSGQSSPLPNEHTWSSTGDDLSALTSTPSTGTSEGGQPFKSLVIRESLHVGVFSSPDGSSIFGDGRHKMIITGTRAFGRCRILDEVSYRMISTNGPYSSSLMSS